MNASQDTHECPVCGATMHTARTIQTGATLLRRLRCTCGHLEEIKSDDSHGGTIRPLIAVDYVPELMDAGFFETPHS